MSDAYKLKGSAELDLTQLLERLQVAVGTVQASGKAMEQALAVRATLDAAPLVQGLNEAAATGPGVVDLTLRVAELSLRAGMLVLALRSAGIEIGSLNTPIGDLSIGTGVLRSALTALRPALAYIGPAIAAVGVAAAVAAPLVVGFAASVAALNSTPVKLAAAAEQTKIAFTTLTGSAKNAEATLRDLKAFADTTPFEFPEIAKAAKQLIAMGIDSAQVTDRLRMLGDIGSGLGQPLGELAFIFGQIKSQGRAMTEDLNQFAGRGIPVFSALARVLKTNETGVRDLASTGRIGFAEVDAALRTLTESGGKFQGMTGAQSQSLAGLQSTAGDAFGSMLTKIGEVLVENLGLKDSIRSVSDLINAISPIVVGVFDRVSTVIRPAVDLTRSIVDLVSTLGGAVTNTGKAIADVFGIEGVSALGRFLTALNPINFAIGALRKIVEALTAALKFLSDTAESISLLTGDQAEKNAKAITKEEVQAALQRRGKTPGSQAAGGQAAASPAAIAGGSAGGSSRSPAEAIADRLKELAVEERVIRLRAAGREDEAKLLELRAKTERDVAGKSSEEAAAIRRLADAKAETLRANAQESRHREAMGEIGRTIDARLQAGIAALRAAGEEDKARVAEIRNRYAKEGKDASPERRKALAQAEAAEVAKVQADAAAKNAKTSADTQAKRIKDATETTDRIAKYQLEAQLAVLEAQGRAEDAKLLRFDAEWRAKLGAIKNAAERTAAEQAYAAERYKLQADARGRQARGGSQTAGLAPGIDDPAVLPRTIAEAQRRVREAKGGSGERELGRIDLKDMLGKRLTDDEVRRRGVLADRFGRTPDVLGAVPDLPAGLPRPTDRIADASRLAGGRQAGLSSAPTPFTVNPTVTANAKEIVAACEVVVAKVVKREIVNLRGELAAAAIAGSVGGRL